MPKGPNGEKRPADTIGCAVNVAKIATGEQEDATYVSPNRRKSGVAGAKARADRLSAERRSEIATKAATTRWEKGEKEMSEDCAVAFRNLLPEGLELQNIKFLTGRSPNKEGVCAEASRVIKSALDRGLLHSPPVTGKVKIKL